MKTESGKRHRGHVEKLKEREFGETVVEDGKVEGWSGIKVLVLGLQSIVENNWSEDGVFVVPFPVTGKLLFRCPIT